MGDKRSVGACSDALRNDPGKAVRTEEAKMRDWTPTRKVTAGILGGAIATVVAMYLPEAGVKVYPGAEAAFATIFSFLCSYIVREDA